MTTIIYEKNGRSEACCDFLQRSGALADFNKLFLLPIPTVGDKGLMKGSDLTVAEALCDCNEGCIAVGYGVPEDVCEEVANRGGVVIDVSSDEDFLLDNARLTALGTLGIILGSSAFAPSDLSIGVVGYGRIGKFLTEMLLYHGAGVTVFSSKESVRLDLGSYGIETVSSLDLPNLSRLDILINTAPARLFDPEQINALPLRVIDLASGDPFAGCPAVERYPSLPAKEFPGSAGVCLARSVLRTLGEEGKS